MVDTSSVDESVKEAFVKNPDLVDFAKETINAANNDPDGMVNAESEYDYGMATDDLKMLTKIAMKGDLAEELKAAHEENPDAPGTVKDLIAGLKTQDDVAIETLDEISSNHVAPKPDLMVGKEAEGAKSGTTLEAIVASVEGQGQSKAVEAPAAAPAEQAPPAQEAPAKANPMEEMLKGMDLKGLKGCSAQEHCGGDVSPQNVSAGKGQSKGAAAGM